ncbi:MAG: AraC family transcriptional regulator [Hungatella sp.]|nr:AraC family transcriptional regulator [Hungatella sp.]
MITEEEYQKQLFISKCYLSANSQVFDMRRVHCHGFLELNYQVDGIGQYVVADRTFHLIPGDLFVLDSRLPHRKVFLTEQPGALIGFTIDLAESRQGRGADLSALMEGCPMLHKKLAGMKGGFIIHDASLILEKFQTMLDEYADTCNEIRLSAICTELFFIIDRLLSGIRPLSPTQQMQKRYADLIKLHIQDYYKSINNMKDIEARMGLNGIYLERVFRHVTGGSIWQYLIATKLEAAAHILRETDTPIDDIDQLIGMNSRQSFYLQFKKRYGVSPSAYRKKYKAPLLSQKQQSSPQ